MPKYSTNPLVFGISPKNIQHAETSASKLDSRFSRLNSNSRVSKRESSWKEIRFLQYCGRKTKSQMLEIGLKKTNCSYFELTSTCRTVK